MIAAALGIGAHLALTGYVMWWASRDGRRAEAERVERYRTR